MIKPSIGRIVHYFPQPGEFGLHSNSTSPCAAIITAVWSDTCVNLKVLVDGPHDHWVTSRMLREGSDDCGFGVWAWPERV